MNIPQLLFPYGSKRRGYARDKTQRLKYSRAYSFSRKNYNHTRQQYYAVQSHKRLAKENVKFSIVVPCFNTPQKYLLPLLDSVFAQNYANWELVLIDASDDEKISQEISQASEHDKRITYKKIYNKGIARNTNEGISIATGDYICFLDHDDTLDPYALYENSKAITSTGAELVYSDEDKISDDGNMFFEPHFKPDFSLDMLHSVNYITHFVCVSKDLAEKAGMIRPGFEGAQDYDFLLRVVDKTNKIHHIPKVLYHWRQADGSTAANFNNKKHVLTAGERALNEHYKRRGVKAEARGIKNRPGFYQTIYKLDDKTKRAVVVCLPETTPIKMRNFITDQFKELSEVKDDKVAVESIESLDEAVVKKYDQVLLVEDLVRPVHLDQSLNNIFGLLSSGADFVTPRLITRGRIANCGFVANEDGGLIPLFRGVDPQMPSFFGSIEWTRNIDAVSSSLIAFDTNRLGEVKGKKLIGGTNDRVVCLGEYEYQLFGDNRLQKTGSSKHFNPNFDYEVYPKMKQYDIAQESLEISE